MEKNDIQFDQVLIEVTAVVIFGQETSVQPPTAGLEPSVVSDAISLVLFLLIPKSNSADVYVLILDLVGPRRVR